MPRLKSPKLELMLAIWPDRSTTWERIGDADFGGCRDTFDSMWLALRMGCPTDPDCYRDSAARVVRDTGLWMFFDATEGRVPSIEPRLHDVHSATLSDAEALVKTLRGLVRKMPAPRPDFRLYLQDVCAALGIRKAVQYHGIGVRDTFVPVYDALPLVFADFDRRMARCVAVREQKQRQSA